MVNSALELAVASVALIVFLKAASAVSSVSASKASSTQATAHLVLDERYELLISVRTIHVDAMDFHDLHEKILELGDVHLLQVGLMGEEHGALVLLLAVLLVALVLVAAIVLLFAFVLVLALLLIVFV